MNKLLVKKLDPEAKLPTVANVGEDLAYDLYSIETCYVMGDGFTWKVRTGIAARFIGWDGQYGLIIKDRSSLACKGVYTAGGVIDPGYTDEIVVLMHSQSTYHVHKGDKIAQLIPQKVFTSTVEEVKELPASLRGDKGFGSSGND